MKGDSNGIVICPVAECLLPLKAKAGKSSTGSSTLKHGARKALYCHMRNMHPLLKTRERSLLADEAVKGL